MQIHMFFDPRNGRVGWVIPARGDLSLLGSGDWAHLREIDWADVPNEIRPDLQNKGFHVTPDALIHIG
jgi:hypothetical protein